MNLREKVYDNFRSAIDVIIHQKPDILVHSGDLFDVVKPKTRSYTTVSEALDRRYDPTFYYMTDIIHKNTIKAKTGKTTVWQK